VTWGMRLVTIASIFVNTNNGMLQHLQRDSEEVSRLMRDYAPISNDFRTKFAYETLPTVLPMGGSMMVSVSMNYYRYLAEYIDRTKIFCCFTRTS
jgi:hypothetical protein